MSPPDLKVEAWVDDAWRTLPLQHAAGCTVDVGRPDRAEDPDPATLDATIRNSTGDWDPGNPTGTYFGSLQEGNPGRARVGVDVYDTIGSRTATDSWGTSTSGHAWTVTGTAADFDVTGGKALMSFAAANVTRSAELADSAGLVHGEWRGTVVVLPATAVTGAPVYWEVTGRTNTPNVGWGMACVLSTTNTVSIQLTGGGGALTSSILTDLTHTAVTSYAYALQIIGWTVRGKVWDSAGIEPQEWMLEAVDSDIVMTGTWFVSATVSGGNTNTKPFTFGWDEMVLSAPLLAGDVTKLAPQWDTTGTNATVGLTMTGLLGRFEQGGESPANSALYRACTGGGAVSDIVAYWPCEDEKGALTLASGIAGAAPMNFTGSPSIASFTDFNSSKSTPVTSADSAWTGKVPAYTSTGDIIVHALVNLPAGTTDGSSVITFTNFGTATTFYVYYQGGTGSLSVSIYDVAGVAIYTGGDVGFGINDRPSLLTFRAQNSGADMNWDLTLRPLNSLLLGGQITGTLVGYQVGQADFAVVNRDFNCAGAAVGHVIVQSALTGFDELLAAARAHLGETAGDRAQRLCDEDGIPFTYWGALDDTQTMGPQLPRPTITLLRECAQAELTTIMDDPGSPGLWFRTYAATANQDPRLALDYSLGHLADRFLPVRDRVGLLNDVTITREGGSARRAEVTTGTRSVSAIGRYDAAWTRNVETDDQAEQLAWWHANTGTMGGDRFPQITLRRTRSTPMLTASLRLPAVGLQPDDRVTVANADSINRPDTINLLARGIQHYIDAEQHRVSLRCTPGDVWQVFQIEDADYGRLASAGSVLATAATSNATALSVASTAGPLCTTTAARFPVDMLIKGERVTVTDIDTVPVGTPLATAAVNASNTNVTPTIHASAALGDLLLLVAAIRNSGTGTPTTPTGWRLLINSANVRVFGAIYASVADTATYRVTAAPTVSFTGGVANATTQAKIIVLPGDWYDVDRAMVAYADTLNPSAQNITTPGLLAAEDNCAVLTIGWKQDDYTSVATLAGMTELAEDSTTTGDDMSLVTDYVVQTTKATIAASEFVVTGGATAISRAIVAAFRCDVQTFTATRSVNDVVKSHTAATPVTLATRTGWSYGRKTA